MQKSCYIFAMGQKDVKKCIVCGDETDSLQRGLCYRDYGRFRRMKAKIPLELQDAFEEELINSGKLLPGMHAMGTVFPFSMSKNKIQALDVY